MPLPEDMDVKLLLWRWFAATYNWTPDMVENAPLEVQHWFPIIEDAARVAQDRINQQESKSSRHGTQRR